MAKLSAMATATGISSTAADDDDDDDDDDDNADDDVASMTWRGKRGKVHKRGNLRTWGHAAMLATTFRLQHAWMLRKI